MNAQSRSPDADPTPPEPSPADDPPPAEAVAADAPSGRSLLGRLFASFTADPTDTAPERAEPEDNSPARGAPSLARLRQMKVDDVALPKNEIVAAPVTASLLELVDLFRENGVSRIPIYRDTLDTPLGLIHLKDLALQHGFGKPEAAFALRPMLRPLLFVPPSMSAATLLQTMQQKRIHMALVIDEYGGVDGLVTIEDLIEQVIGEIEDEHDDLDQRQWQVEKPGQWLIEARAELDDVEDATGLVLGHGDEGEEVDTLGGLIVLLAGRVPAPGEVVQHPSGASFEVVEGDSRKLRVLRLRFPAAAE
ncbi:CBS domain-containing protein [Paracoccus sp. S-4012]|uniref:hemolysin family protein n=1 Tax=Paracoccus sp. S-4012 TaxID=2665648 RepID=UPI0012AFE7FC|nr:hemolysin family protein [Paracoccus sp. S-4012]MRX50077.1 CBS domain-containing protein [Paracoccus sp. S-4012]